MSRHQKEEVPARPQTLAERALAEALATGDLRRRELITRKRADQEPRPRVIRRLTCPVCGRQFEQDGRGHNYSQRQTCGAACSVIWRQRRMSEGWSPDQERESARQEAHHASPLSGPWATHCRAEEWRLIDPQGRRWAIRNCSCASIRSYLTRPTWSPAGMGAELRSSWADCGLSGETGADPGMGGPGILVQSWSNPVQFASNPD